MMHRPFFYFPFLFFLFFLHELSFFLLFSLPVVFGLMVPAAGCQTNGAGNEKIVSCVVDFRSRSWKLG